MASNRQRSHSLGPSSAVDIPATRQPSHDDGFGTSMPQGSPSNKVFSFFDNLLGRQRSDGQLRDGSDPRPLLTGFSTPPGSELSSPAPSPRLTLQELVQAGDAMRASGQLRPLPVTPGSPTPNSSRRESLNRQDSLCSPHDATKTASDNIGWVMSASGVGF
eukprot:m.21066 g.21066  ORF g.21066 m.21066 type:complete len:161 (+) comp11092_c0_seq1:285-767(+)